MNQRNYNSGKIDVHQRIYEPAHEKVDLVIPKDLYYMSVNSKSSREIALMRRLAWAFAVRLCDKHPFSHVHQSIYCKN